MLTAFSFAPSIRPRKSLGKTATPSVPMAGRQTSHLPRNRSGRLAGETRLPAAYAVGVEPPEAMPLKGANK